MNSITGITDINVGMRVEETFSFSREELNIFGKIATDFAPVHYDSAVAKSMGYENCLVFGFLVASKFSGLLGNQLPGPASVLHQVSWKNLKPVYVGNAIKYIVTVKQVAVSVKAVVLDLQGLNEAGEKVIVGTAQCGFIR